jgi:undecaprenyl-diphosphatase
LENILQLDEYLFFSINQGWSHPWLDAIMPIWREKTTWIPLYMIFIAYAFFQYSWKKAILFVFILAATVGIADQISSQLIKKNVKRLRPCHQMELQTSINVLVPCGSGYSFTSSHATNHFAIATLVSFTLFNASRVALVLLFFWASTIAIGQVYVGVHYPLDISVGGCIGFLIGSFGTYLFKILYRILPASKKIA